MQNVDGLSFVPPHGAKIIFDKRPPGQTHDVHIGRVYDVEHRLISRGGDIGIFLKSREHFTGGCLIWPIDLATSRWRRLDNLNGPAL